MSNRVRTKKKPTEQPLTERQQHIQELRAQLNAPDPNAIEPFTRYKILTYLFVLIMPLVPVAFYRIWCKKSDFTPIEQKVWTAIIVVIAVYLVSMTFF
jgi:hypothetical protein